MREREMKRHGVEIGGVCGERGEVRGGEVRKQGVYKERDEKKSRQLRMLAIQREFRATKICRITKNV